MTLVQLGRGMTEKEIAVRLIMSFADRLTTPVHFVPQIVILAPSGEWPQRGIMHA